MKSLLFALGLALCCFVQAEWKEVTRTNKEDMLPSGRWVIFAVACNISEPLRNMRNMSAFIIELTEAQDNVFNVSVLYSTSDGCKNITAQIIKGEDGKYHSPSGNDTATIKSMKILKDFIMTTIVDDDKSKSTILQGPRPIEDPEVTQKFKEECKNQLGYSEDQIVVFDPDVKCQ